MARGQETITSDFYCVRCGKKGIPIARKISKQREAEHLKKLYCIYCKDEVNHAEIRPFGDYTYEKFLEEFQAGRFVNEKKVAIADLLSCSKINCQYNKSGKCWNANNSYDCSHKPKED